MSRTRTVAAEQETTCELCEQSVSPDETLTIETETDERTLCVFCARSLFDVEGGTARVEGFSTAEREQMVRTAPTDGERARDVTWRPPRDTRRGGLAGTFLQYHRLSLSLLWAIHRTNVRLIERTLDEVDTQTVLVLAMTLGTVAMAALATVSGV
jgi:hypothetical protein